MTAAVLDSASPSLDGASSSSSSTVVVATERLRATLGRPGGLPFLLDEELISPDVRYTGPGGAQAIGREQCGKKLLLVSILLLLTRCPPAALRSRYLALHSSWARDLPQRLASFEAASLALFALGEPRGVLRLRWRARFGAPLPPRALARLREAGGATAPPPLRPDGLLAASLSLSSEITLGDDGRVVSHVEKISDGYDVQATVARFEFLVARRGDELLPLAYARVLRATSIEEAADAAGGTANEKELSAGFAAMVFRNFGTGLAIGAGIYVAVRVVRVWLATHGADAFPP